eukprot:TRINITY_DN22814_c0_g1_i2.p1 TRINITY_DN22814_c0_g1~~TRINITY_DN22814_c0_g1_i2.p1  ORF type:complete len:447 (-),score=67.71 TRINITY_DN22814_c0_g1_i2:101-1441(-)
MHDFTSCLPLFLGTGRRMPNVKSDESVARALQQEEDARYAAELARSGQHTACVASLPHAQAVPMQMPAATAPPPFGSRAQLYVPGGPVQHRQQPAASGQPAAYLEAGCCLSTGLFLIGYIFVVVVCASSYVFYPALAVPTLAIGPPVFIIAFFALYIYPNQALSMQVVFTALEAIGLMLPLMLIVLPISLLLAAFVGIGMEAATSEDISAKSVLAAFVASFGLAALPEEALKMLAVWRLVPTTADPRGLLVYGMAAATGFAAVENVLYVGASQGFATGVARAALSVPGHLATGTLIGGRLAMDRFLRSSSPLGSASQQGRAWPRLPPPSSAHVLVAPILLHGSYNFCIFLGTQAADSMVGLLLLLGAFCIDLAGYALAREYARQLAAVPLVNARQLAATGSLPAAERLLRWRTCSAAWACAADALGRRSSSCRSTRAVLLHRWVHL